MTMTEPSQDAPAVEMVNLTSVKPVSVRDGWYVGRLLTGGAVTGGAGMVELGAVGAPPGTTGPPDPTGAPGSDAATDPGAAAIGSAGPGTASGVTGSSTAAGASGSVGSGAASTIGGGVASVVTDVMSSPAAGVIAGMVVPLPGAGKTVAEPAVALEQL